MRTSAPGSAGVPPALADAKVAAGGPVWHSRGYLPHWEAGEVPQSIIFRLADSLPASILERWREELKNLSEEECAVERRARIEVALDRGRGEALLSHPRVAKLTQDALLHFDAVRYRLHAWVVMPNHVHVLVTPLDDWTLSVIVHSWKSFTAKKANALLGREGAFWAAEYFDRAIRDDEHYAKAVSYIEGNPVKAGLCRRAEEWLYSSAFVAAEKSGRDARAPRDAAAASKSGRDEIRREKSGRDASRDARYE
jgi:putative DNA methylase